MGVHCSAGPVGSPPSPPLALALVGLGLGLLLEVAACLLLPHRSPPMRSCKRSLVPVLCTGLLLPFVLALIKKPLVCCRSSSAAAVLPVALDGAGGEDQLLVCPIDQLLDFICGFGTAARVSMPPDTSQRAPAAVRSGISGRSVALIITNN
jgi:hypothetical protein